MSTLTTRSYDGLTREELYELAQERDLPGRSSMSKDELVAALELDDTGPEAVSLILRQHATFRSMFEDFEALSDRPSQRKQELVREIITLLVKHAEIEEQVFYPAVRAELDDLDDEVDEGLEEHHAAELLLAELDRLPPSAPRYDAKVTVLIENVLHHMEEEEEELLPKVREGLSEERRRELGGAMQRVWEVAPTRPHPAAPDQPPANVLLGIATTAWDLTVTAGRWAVGRIRRK